MTASTPTTEALADRLLGVLNDGALALMISIGHRTGLFDTLAELPPSTSVRIANGAGLNERYVREWLGAMVTGRLVDYDPAREVYHLPREHAACLTRSAVPNNLAAFTQYIPLLGRVEDEIVECFERGGGVPYASYPRFHQVMAEESVQTVVAALVDDILPLAPGLPARLRSGIDVLDIGCGSGLAVHAMAKAFPTSRFTGYDFSPEAIERAAAEALRLALPCLFEVTDVGTLDEPNQYDLATAFDAIHDQRDPAGVLRNVYAALRPDGMLLMQDIRASTRLEKNMDHRIGTFLYTISCLHCMSVSLAQGGAGLGTMWGEEQALAMLREAGFERIEVAQLPHDFQNSYYLARKR